MLSAPISVATSRPQNITLVVTCLGRLKISSLPRSSEPTFTTDNEFIGPTFPDKIIGLGTTLNLWERLSLDMLGEFQTGGYNINYVGFQNANRGNWRPCYDVQRKIVAASKGDQSALSGVNALQRAQCALDRTIQFADWFIEPIDFFRLRYATLSYKIPPQWLRGMQNATLTLSGRNLFYSSDYSGLDPESADQSDSQVGRREYYVLPQLRSFALALRVGW